MYPSVTSASSANLPSLTVSGSLPASVASAQPCPGPMLPQLGMPRRSGAGCDVIYLGGAGIPLERGIELRQRCSAIGLVARIVGPQDLTRGLWNEIDDWHFSGDLQSHTAVLVDLHGSFRNGRHTVDVESNRPEFVTLNIVRAIREAGVKLSRPYFKGWMSLHFCQGGNLREALGLIEGHHLVCAGKKSIYVDFSRLLIMQLLDTLAREKAANRHPDRNVMFNAVSSIAPCTVSLSEAGHATRVQYARLPQDLDGACQSRILDAFRQRIGHGKLTQAEAFVARWPWLLCTPLYGSCSAFSFAYDQRRADMMEMILRHDAASWQRDLPLLLPVVKQFPQWGARLSVLINQVLKQDLDQALSTCGPDPSSRREKALFVATSHLYLGLQKRDAGDVVPVEHTLAQSSAPMDSPAALDWHLIDMTGYNAAIHLNLPPADVAHFKSELRSRLLAVMQVASAMVWMSTGT